MKSILKFFQTEMIIPFALELITDTVKNPDSKRKYGNILKQVRDALNEAYPEAE
jgi:hypothetical protein